MLSRQPAHPVLVPLREHDLAVSAWNNFTAIRFFTSETSPETQTPTIQGL
jgi:hypothetical protein